MSLEYFKLLYDSTNDRLNLKVSLVLLSFICYATMRSYSVVSVCTTFTSNGYGLLSPKIYLSTIFIKNDL